MGLVPTFPVTSEVGTSVIPDFDKITKCRAPPRFTRAEGSGAADIETSPLSPAADATGPPSSTSGNTMKERSSAAPCSNLDIAFIGIILLNSLGGMTFPSREALPPRTSQQE